MTKIAGGLFAHQSRVSDNVASDGISDGGYQHFQHTYTQAVRSPKEDLFYYIYGLLHSPEYRPNAFRTVYLSRELPQVSLPVKQF